MEEKEEEGGGAPSHNLFNILQGGQ
jgi:hypothetical protein